MASRMKSSSLRGFLDRVGHRYMTSSSSRSRVGAQTPSSQILERLTPSTGSTPLATSQSTTMSRPRDTVNIARELNRGGEKRDQTVKEAKIRSDYARHLPRRIKAGDVYSPHDLSAAEAQNWMKFRRPGTQLRQLPKRERGKPTDICDATGINPLENYKNFKMLSDYVSDTGRILPITRTGLRPVNQRRMAKAIKRATAMGLMPSVHRHPLIMNYENRSIDR